MKQQVPSLQFYFDQEFVANIPLNASIFLIGRKPGCHFRLLDDPISREHCRITVSEKGEVIAEDLNSTNGTWVNETRIIKQPIKPADVITVGRCRLVFCELEPKRVQDAFGRASWTRFLGRGNKPNFLPPRGKYLIPQDNLITQFDAVSYAMVRDQAEADSRKRPTQDYLKRLPRLQVISEQQSRKEEVTKFSVSQNIFVGDEDHTLPIQEPTLSIFAQPEVTLPWLKLPWKTVEKVVIPLLLVLILVGVGQYLLTVHIDAEMERFEQSWETKLVRVEEKLRFSDDRAFETRTPKQFASITPSRRAQRSTEEVWERIEEKPDFRNFLIFLILDEVLASEDISWTIDKALTNLSKVSSVTDRLPSMKQMRVVLNSSGSPFNMEGLRQGRVVFLSERGTSPSASLTKSYGAYKRSIGPRLAQVNQCAASRSSIAKGKVVLAFSVSSKGRPTSVFVNEDRSSREPKLWSCVRNTISKLRLPPPPGGRMSVVYTFNFAGPTKVTF